MLPLSPDSLALRAAIGLIDPFFLALLVGCLSLPLSLRRTTTRAFSGYCAVFDTRSLRIPVIYYVFSNSVRVLFSPVEWKERCWRVLSRPSVVTSILKTNLSHRRVSYLQLYQQYSSSEAFYFECVRTKLCFRRSS